MDSIPVPWNVYPSTAEYHAQRAAACGAEGAFTDDEWKALCDLYNNRCLSCRKKLPLTVDHVVPLSCGGSNYITNIQPICGPCNYSKARRTIDYRPATETFTPLPFAPTPKRVYIPRKRRERPVFRPSTHEHPVTMYNAPYLVMACEMIAGHNTNPRRIRSEYNTHAEALKRRNELIWFLRSDVWNHLGISDIEAIMDIVETRLSRK